MKHIAIWGAGSTGQAWSWSIRNSVFVDCFFTNTEKKFGTIICGIPVKRWLPDYNTFIVIASSSWKDISAQLIQAGKRPVVDFMPWFAYSFGGQCIDYAALHEMYILNGNYNTGWFSRNALLKDKKIAVIYGNCQTGYLRDLFTMCKSFCADYVIVKIQMVCEYKDNPEYWKDFLGNREFWENVDLFIYQTVNETNRFAPEIATDNILKMLRNDCRLVNIVNIFFSGYFPQSVTDIEKKTPAELQCIGPFIRDDIYIDRLIQEHYTAEEILTKIKDPDFISSEDIWKKVQDSFSELKKREMTVDVRISDYLEENYTKRQLFYSENHPCQDVLVEYMGRILKFLGYDWTLHGNEDVSLQCSTLKGQDIPVYPAIIQEFGLKQYETRFYPNRYMDNLGDTMFDFDEFIRLYIQSRTIEY